MSGTIFLCSCSQDLLEHWEEVYRLLCKIDREWTCVHSQDAGDEVQDKYATSSVLISQSDLCVIVVGHFYESDPSINDQSLTAAEWELVEKAGKDVLVFMASEDFSIQARHLKNLSENSLKQQRGFRSNLIKKAKISSNGTITLLNFDALSDLLHIVEVQFFKWLRYRPSYVDPSQIYNENSWQANPHYSFSKFPNKSSLGSPNPLFATIRSKMIPQDVMPYIPVILEATKFLFDEVRNWIDDVRKKASAQTKPQDLSHVPYDQILNAKGDILPFISNEFDAADVRDITALVEKIRLERAVLNQLEIGVVTATGRELAVLKVEVNETSDSIVKNVGKLESLLGRIYK